MNFSKLLAALVVAIGACAAAHAQDAGSADAAQPLTRAEVLADLQIWRESGMAALNDGEGGPDLIDTRVRAEARYAQMRASPAFAALVERIARERGEALQLAGK